MLGVTTSLTQWAGDWGYLLCQMPSAPRAESQGRGLRLIAAQSVNLHSSHSQR